MSTNKDGFADSFLKAGASTPISTSFVHDCSVMYLYNDKTKTHAMYHAAPYCKKDRLEFMLKKLMPEGFTRGAIIPGNYIFYRGHEHNMKNMFNVMKKNNPKAIVNVYYDSSRFPEIVGYKGRVYEIQNKKVKEQMDEGLLDALDYGQASFQILDLQGYNTFNDIENLKERFSDIKIPKTIAKIFTDETNNFEKVAKLVKSASSIKELEELQAVFPGKETKILFNKKKEDLLIDELNKINSLPDLRTFYAKHRSKFIRMGRLLDLFQDKKKEIL